MINEEDIGYSSQLFKNDESSRSIVSIEEVPFNPPMADEYEIREQYRNKGIPCEIPVKNVYTMFYVHLVSHRFKPGFLLGMVLSLAIQGTLFAIIVQSPFE